MSNYNEDYDRENEARFEHEATQQAEIEARARAEADYYEQLPYEDPDFYSEQLISVFAFNNFGQEAGHYVNWLLNIQFNLI